MIILYLLYGISIVGAFIVYLLSAKKSETASAIGRSNYLMTASVIALIPIINTIVLIWSLIELAHAKPLKEHDIVEILHPSLNLPAGSQGKIVYVYEEIGVFEVEFNVKSSRLPIVRWARSSEIRLVKPKS